MEGRQLLRPADTVLVSVSGGGDSVALLHCLAALRVEWGLSLHVLHFNHQLRPEAVHEEAFGASPLRFERERADDYELSSFPSTLCTLAKWRRWKRWPALFVGRR